jgi:hypothetical protein
MKRTSSARTPLLCPLAASLAIAFTASPDVVWADGRAQLKHARVPPDIAALAPPPDLRGAVSVTNCDDGGPGSLREVYFNAVDGDTIDLTQLSCSTISLTTGIALTNSGAAHYVTLIGPGRDHLTIDGGNSNRVLVHNGEGYLRLIDLSITRGSYIGYYGGGCIYSYGGVHTEQVNISQCSLFSGGSDRAYGGAIYSRGRTVLVATAITDSTAHSASANSGGGGVCADSIAIIGSTISGNTATTEDNNHIARGGGVLSTADTQVYYSTIANNTADNGGGLSLFGLAASVMTIIDSTISGNHAHRLAGGVYSVSGPLLISNSTIAANAATLGVGAGVFVFSDTSVVSSIIAGNTSPDPQGTTDIGSTIPVTIIGANNLIIEATMPLPPDTIHADPLLGQLQDNGGFTPTHALLPGSPGIDQGLQSGLAFDQRGAPYVRVFGVSADIGAFERQAPDRLFADGFEG